jgi:hypothetical protein
MADAPKSSDDRKTAVDRAFREGPIPGAPPAKVEPPPTPEEKKRREQEELGLKR